MLSIGEFSRASGLTVKTLRFYHEQGILKPSRVDAGSGYRFYDLAKLESARVIRKLRELDFSIAEIAEIVGNHEDDWSIAQFLEAKRQALKGRIQADRNIVKRLNEILHQPPQTETNMQDTSFTIQHKTLEPITIASLKMRGKYSDCGQGFAQIGRKFGRHICGKPMLLMHDDEYREDDAVFEAAMPVRGGTSQGEIVIKELAECDCISLVHRGPFNEIGPTYAKLLLYAKEHDFQFQLPTREVYHKGPGMIFRGNPKFYLTEVQFTRAKSQTLQV